MSTLEPAYDGPFLLKRKISEMKCVLQLVLSTNNERVVHHNKLKPNEVDYPPSWLKKARRNCFVIKFSLSSVEHQYVLFGKTHLRGSDHICMHEQ